MPILRSAIKKLRQDRVRTARNRRWRSLIAGILRQFRIHPTEKGRARAFSLLDRAARRRIIHPNKAARIKSRLLTRKEKAT